MAKKKRTPQPTGPVKYKGLPLETRTVGSGTTEQVQYKVPEEFQGLLLPPWKSRSAEEQQQAFGIRFGGLAEWAKQTLEAAGLPFKLEPLWEGYTIVGGTLPGVPEQSILNLVKVVGYRNPNREWYAAKVLASLETIWRGIRDGNDRGEPVSPVAVAILAYQLGRLVREADIRLGKIGKQAHDAGRVRGEQQKAARAPEHVALREAAAKLKNTLTKRAKAEYLKKSFPHLKVETIRKLI